MLSYDIKSLSTNYSCMNEVCHSENTRTDVEVSLGYLKSRYSRLVEFRKECLSYSLPPIYHLKAKTLLPKTLFDLMGNQECTKLPLRA